MSIGKRGIRRAGTSRCIRRCLRSTVMVKPLLPATSKAEPASMVIDVRSAVEDDLAGAGDDFHALGGGGAEVEFSGINQAEGFLGAIGEMHGVGDDLAVEIDVGFGIDGDVGE